MMSHPKIYILALLFIPFVWMGCKKDSQDIIVEDGLEYFPMAEGLYKVYEVDSIHIEAGLELFDTTHFFIKEIQDSLYMDIDGFPSMLIKRLKRRSVSDPWLFQDAWVEHRTSARAERTEENVKKVMLAFPPSLDLEWDLNAFNIDNEWKASYSEIYYPFEVNSLSFDSCITATQKDNITLINRWTDERVYSKHVGLVHKKLEVLDFNTIVPFGTVPDINSIEYGVKLTYNLIEYGFE